MKKLDSTLITKQHIDEALTLLCREFPSCFILFERQRRPIKIGIVDDLMIRLGAAGLGIDRRLLGQTLRHYTGNVYYRKAQTLAAPRVDLDGNPAGEVSETDATHAATEVAAHRAAAIRKQQESYRKPARPEPPPAMAPTPEPEPAPVAPTLEFSSSPSAAPKRLGLADLRAAAAARRQRESVLR